MSIEFDSSNPYSAPTSQGNFGGQPPPPSNVKILLPAIFLIVLGVVGAVLSTLSTFAAIYLEPPPAAPNVSEEMRAFREGAFGTLAAVTQGIFILVNLTIITGGLMMAQCRNWVFALVACILAIINFGSFCCVLGLPVGIWGIVVLSMDDVKKTFDSRR